MRSQHVTRAYARYAPVYDLLFGAVFRAGRTASAKRLNPQHGERILEVGVGTGLMLPLYPAHCTVVGIDISREMLARAHKRIEREELVHVQLHCMDAADMRFPDNSFDAVMAAYVVTAVPDHRRVLREIVRVCRPGGRVIFVNHFSNGNPVLGRMERTFSGFFKHAGFRTDLSVADVLDASGLRVVSVQSIDLLGLWRLVECVTAEPR